MTYQKGKLLINMSMLIKKPTGITNYLQHILPYLQTLKPICLASEKYYLQPHNFYAISERLSPDYGTKGHFLRLMWTQFKLPQIYQKLNLNLIFSPVPEAPLYSKCRSIVMVHDLIPLRFPKKKSPLTPYFRYYIPQVCREAKHIICNSKATANDIIDYFNIPAHKITPIYLGCDLEKFKPVNESEKSDQIPYFLYLGRHDPHKNVPNLISAFAKIPKVQNYQLWLAGPGDGRYTPNLKRQTIELGIEKQVKFLDYVSAQELPLIMAKAMAFVFTTFWEGFGFPVLEAMACGTPVITSNVSSLPEVAGDAAILVNPHQTQEITDAMVKIINDNTIRLNMRNLGLKRAKEFSWQKTAQETLRILDKYL